jgi:hypothetical protein
MFAVLLRFTLSFVYKVYIGFLSRMRDWTVAVAQYSTVQYSTVQYSTVQYSTVQYSTVQYSTVNLLVKVQYICIFENMAVYTPSTCLYIQP